MPGLQRALRGASIGLGSSSEYASAYSVTTRLKKGSRELKSKLLLRSPGSSRSPYWPLPPFPVVTSPVELKLKTLALKLWNVMGCPTPQKIDQRVKLISRLSPKFRSIFCPLYQGRAG